MRVCLAIFSVYFFATQQVILLTSSASYSSSGRGVFHDFARTNNIRGNREADIVVQDIPTSPRAKPRVVGHYYTLADSESYVGTERLSQALFDNAKTRIFRGEFMTKEEERHEKKLLDSEDYYSGEADTMEDMGEDCRAQYDWQERSFPTCNHLMETDATNLNLVPMFHENHYNNKHDLPLASSSLHSYSKLISNGYWRDVWTVENLLRNQNKFEETFILKTMRYDHDYVPRNYDRHRRDAVAMERLTSSNFIMDIYASCGNSGLFEYADGGSLYDSIGYNYYEKSDEQKPWTSKEKLVIAYQAATGIADLHNFAKEGVPAVAHTDIGSSQFVYVEEVGVYKLNDFNRARFLAKNEKTNEICTYEVGNNPGSFRSPEEYEYSPQTEKVDVYSFGNVLYYVLTGKYAFENEKSTKAQKLVKEGARPHISSSIRKSTDPFDRAMIEAIEMCWIQDPKNRASAREVQKFVLSALQRLGVHED